MSSTKMDMNHPELKIKGATIVGMDHRPEMLDVNGAEKPSAPEDKPKKSKKKE